jgi:membrane protein implicated in regulation of membrane protease activity
MPRESTPQRFDRADRDFRQPLLPLDTIAPSPCAAVRYIHGINPERMDFFQWHWWAGVALVLLIAEIFVPGFFLLCLGIGCAGASIAAALGAGASIQLIAFSALSLLGFFTIRPVLMKRFWKDGGVKTNVDALVGQRGKVSQEFDPGLRLGRVAVGGDDWRAECVNDHPLHIGDLVKIVRVESNTVIVKPLEHGAH